MDGKLRLDSPDNLRIWLTSALEPICDADPAALAKYVMALLKKDKTEAELKDFCVEQLDVFLQAETRGFVDQVFTAIRSRAYIPGAAATAAVSAVKPSESTTTASSSSDSREELRSPQVIQAAPKEQQPRSHSRERPPRRRSAERRPPIPSIVKEERHRSRSPRDRSARSRDPPRNGAADRGRRGDTSGRGGGDRSAGSSHRRRSRSPGKDRLKERSPRPLMEIPLPPPGTEGESELDAALEARRKAKQRRCRDYDEKGFCMQGDRCPFDHGPDPVVVEDNQLPGMIGAVPKVPAASGPFSRPPPPLPGNPPPPPGVDYAPTAAVIPTSVAPPPPTSMAPPAEYNPEAPGLEGSSEGGNYSYPPPPLPPWSARPPPPVLPFHPGAFPPQMPPPGFPPVSGIGGYPMGPHGHTHAMDGGRGRGGGGRGMGRGGPRMGNFRPQAPNWDNKTLEIRKVPPQLNSIVKLNEHFQTFGQIINIQVRYDGDPEAALITFATRPQASNAYKSTSPILNNRFIKVFWHNPDKGEDGAAPGAPNSQPPNPASQPTRLPDRQAFKKVNTTPAPTGGEKAEGVVEEAGKDLEGDRVDVPQSRRGGYGGPFGREAALARRQAKKREKEKRLAFLALHKKKADLLARQMESQKALVGQLEKHQGDAKRTKELLGMFNTLDKANKVLAKEVSELAVKLKDMAAGGGGPRSKEQLEREKLDVELELISRRQAGGDTAPLQQKLTDLKSELVGLATGVGPLMTSTPSHSNESMVLGRRRKSSDSGGPPKRQRSLMMSDKKLDKRPKNVLVTGFKDAQKADVTRHLQSFGEVIDLEDGGKSGAPRLHVTYKTRQQAETAMELAEDYDGVEKALEVTWGPSQSAKAPVAASLSNASLNEADKSLEEEAAAPAAIDRHMSAEEMLKSIDDDPYGEDSDLGEEGEDEVLLG